MVSFSPHARREGLANKDAAFNVASEFKANKQVLPVGGGGAKTSTQLLRRSAAASFPPPQLQCHPSPAGPCTLHSSRSSPSARTPPPHDGPSVCHPPALRGGHTRAHERLPSMAICRGLSAVSARNGEASANLRKTRLAFLHRGRPAGGGSPRCGGQPAWRAVRRASCAGADRLLRAEQQLCGGLVGRPVQEAPWRGERRACRCVCMRCWGLQAACRACGLCCFGGRAGWRQGRKGRTAAD